MIRAYETKRKRMRCAEGFGGDRVRASGFKSESSLQFAPFLPRNAFTALTFHTLSTCEKSRERPPANIC